MIRIKKNINFDFLVLFYYFFGTLVSITYYDIYHPISLSSLGIFLVYNLIKFFNDFKMNKFVLIFIIYHFLIGLLYRNSSDLFTMVLYSIVIFAISLIAKYNKDARKTFSLAIVFMNFINGIVILLSTASTTRYKTVGDLSIQINYYEGIHFSAAALTALLAIMLVFYFQNRSYKSTLLKIGTIFSSLFIIFTLGKVSVLLGLFVAVIVTKIFFFQGKLSKYTRVLSTFIIAGTFLSGWILPFLIKITSVWGINYRLLTGRRDMIWNVYLEYFNKTPFLEKVLGSFFVRTYNDIVQQGFLHPHNQWITILISTGLIGLILYFILFVKAYRYTIKSGDRVGFSYLLALNVYATTDDYILLTAGCINAFLLFYFACHKKD